MRAEELMIGDWVLYNEFIDKTKNKPVKIARLSKHKEEGDISSYSPIPLTAEILEKNGFILIDEKDKYYRWKYAEGVYVNVDFKSEEPYVYISNRCYFASPVCRYVHQLQHALKMCGINKEIKI